MKHCYCVGKKSFRIALGSVLDQSRPLHDKGYKINRTGFHQIFFLY